MMSSKNWRWSHKVQSYATTLEYVNTLAWDRCTFYLFASVFTPLNSTVSSVDWDLKTSPYSGYTIVDRIGVRDFPR